MPYADPEKAKARQRAKREANPELARAIVRASYAKHREKRLAYAKARREEDVEAAKEYQRAMYAKHQAQRVEDARAYRRRNAERLAAEAKAKYHANRDVINERRKACRGKTKEKDYAKIQQWRRENPEAVRKYAVKTLIHDATGLPRPLIPDELVETKMMQLEIDRLLKDRATGDKT